MKLFYIWRDGEYCGSIRAKTAHAAVCEYCEWVKQPTAGYTAKAAK